MWYDLDNAANIFPAISDERNTNVFRVSCELKEDIDATVLQQALDEAMLHFRSFQVVMRRGLFWFYLERVSSMPQVSQEAGRPMGRMFYHNRKELLFAVTYWGSRINLEVFHSVADGGGAMQLLRQIVYKYLTLRYKALHPLSGIPPAAAIADSFSHHYKPERKNSPFKQKAYNIGGTSIEGNNIGIITGTFSATAFLAHVKSKNATATGYLAALMICAIYTELMPARARTQPIAVKVPVDLRKHFRSETARNFFGLVDLVYQFDGNFEADFDKVLAAMQEQLKSRLNPEKLAASMNYNTSAQHNAFARAIPLLLKNLALRIACYNAERTTTCVISNLGRVDMPSEAAEHIKSFSFLLNPTPLHRLKAGICSYGDIFNISFTSSIEETSAQRYIFRHLAAAGLDITITCNEVSHEMV